MLTIFAIIQLLKKYLIDLNPYLSGILFYILVTVGVIIISSISKYAFENYFLNLKSKLDKPVEKPKVLLEAGLKE